MTRIPMDLETYTRSKRPDYAALADIVAAVLQAAISGYPRPLRLQQIQKRAKEPDKLRKKLEDRGILATATLEDDIKDLAGCRLIFYTNSDVSQFLQSGIIQDNFEVDWDRTKIHHPVPGQTAPENLFISNNYVLKLKADRTALPEYARFAGLWCEVQVQTILNHAWSEMGHDIIYKKPVLAGFGGKLFEAIKERLEKIMKEHLLPAGYESPSPITTIRKASTRKSRINLSRRSWQPGLPNRARSKRRSAAIPASRQNELSKTFAISSIITAMSISKAPSMLCARCFPTPRAPRSGNICSA